MNTNGTMPNRLTQRIIAALRQPLSVFIGVHLWFHFFGPPAEDTERPRWRACRNR